MENQQPISSVTVTPDTPRTKPSKAKKYLKNFEIWLLGSARRLEKRVKAVKCGGPFLLVKSRTPDTATQTDKTQELALSHRCTHATLCHNVSDTPNSEYPSTLTHS